MLISYKMLLRVQYKVIIITSPAWISSQIFFINQSELVLLLHVTGLLRTLTMLCSNAAEYNFTLHSFRIDIKKKMKDWQGSLQLELK